MVHPRIGEKRGEKLWFGHDFMGKMPEKEASLFTDSTIVLFIIIPIINNLRELKRWKQAQKTRGWVGRDVFSGSETVHWVD